MTLRRPFCGVALVGVLALLGCPPSPVTPGPDADAAPAPPLPLDAPAPVGACFDACAALAAAGCPEGQSPGCVIAMTHADSDRLVRTPSGEPMTCIAVSRVTTPAAARAAGVPCATP